MEYRESTSDSTASVVYTKSTKKLLLHGPTMVVPLIGMATQVLRSLTAVRPVRDCWVPSAVTVVLATALAGTARVAKASALH